jgi:hypothetical protein
MDVDSDYVTINTDNGPKQAELVSKFKIPNLGDYVIYKLDDEFYGAKYKIDGDNTTLITDLSLQEQKALNEVFEQLEVK